MGRDYIMHHGVPRQQWHHRRWQNPDGSYTDAGFIHYYGHPRIRGQKKEDGEKTIQAKDVKDLFDKLDTIANNSKYSKHRGKFGRSEKLPNTIAETIPFDDYAFRMKDRFAEAKNVREFNNVLEKFKTLAEEAVNNAPDEKKADVAGELLEWKDYVDFELENAPEESGSKKGIFSKLATQVGESMKTKREKPLKRGMFEDASSYIERAKTDERVKAAAFDLSKDAVKLAKLKSEIETMDKQMDAEKLKWIKKQPDLKWFVDKYGRGATSFQDMIDNWKEDKNWIVTSNSKDRAEITGILNRANTQSGAAKFSSKYGSKLMEAESIAGILDEKTTNIAWRSNLTRGRDQDASGVEQAIGSILNDVTMKAVGSPLFDDFWDKH